MSARILLAAARKRLGGGPEWEDPWTINGDDEPGGPFLLSLTLTGADETNTDNGTLYWNRTSGPGTYTVFVYSDFSKTQLVAEGTHAGDSPLILDEQNSSGLSGSIDVFFTGIGADIDDGNTFVGTLA
jgi:hypothetical protein